MNRRLRQGLVTLAVPGLLLGTLAVPVAVAAESTAMVPVSIAPCEGEAPICNPPVHIPVSTAGVLRVSVAVDGTVCSGVTVLVSVDEALEASVSVAPGGSTGQLDLGPVSPGAHTVSVEAEVPIVPGCDFRAWSGSVSITTSGVAAGNQASVGPGGSATVSTIVAGANLAGIRATLTRSGSASN